MWCHHVTQLYHYCPIESQNAICVYAHTTKLEVVLKTLVGILFWKPKIYIEDYLIVILVQRNVKSKSM